MKILKAIALAGILAVACMELLGSEGGDVERWMPKPGTQAVNICWKWQNDFPSGHLFAAPVVTIKTLERSTNSISGWVVTTSSDTNVYALGWLLPVTNAPTSGWAVVKCAKSGTTDGCEVVY